MLSRVAHEQGEGVTLDTRRSRAIIAAAMTLVAHTDALVFDPTVMVG